MKVKINGKIIKVKQRIKERENIGKENKIKNKMKNVRHSGINRHQFIN